MNVSISRRAATWAAFALASEMTELSQEIRLADNGASFTSPQAAERMRVAACTSYMHSAECLGELLQVLQ